MKPLSYLLLACLLAPSAWAAEETIAVTATATGKTADEAEINALQNAVRKALGEFVDAETITNNEEVIKNKVLTYSDGFVKSHTVLSGPEMNSALGKFVITIRAEVVRNKLEESLRTAKILVTEVDGAVLWGKALEGTKGIPEKQELLKKFLWEEMRPERLLISRLVSKGEDGEVLRGPNAKPTQKLLDDGTVELTFHVETFYHLEAYYRDIVPPLVQILDKIADHKIAQAAPVQFPVENITEEKTLITGHAYWGSRGVELRRGQDEVFLTHSSTVFRKSLANFNLPDHSLIVACSVGRNNRGTSHLFSFYALNGNAFGPIFNLSPARALPPINLVLHDKAGSVILHDRWNVEEVGDVRGEEFEEAYDMMSFTVRRGFLLDQGNGEGEKCLILPNLVGINDVLVLERKIILAKEDLKRLTSVKVFYEHLGFPKLPKK